ncbi:hypothetical protein [Actinobacillus minor]|uniref:Uncharacterized protein n=1 Tax=Actinobacillus minor NM305 TaxID=637911 RepID=C5S232_9PAST|nr:hypothetical protein [Actinobacillus minor]EER46959.1 hypothetical protein AM305_09656 [Actinobacillus minor NM305]MDD6909870.1 hypothetical protein [Actinobacillus minor]MDY4714012.1 hypothetical protein [Actinobacillus minor]
MRVRPYPFEDSEIVTKTLCLSQHYFVASPKLIGEPSARLLIDFLAVKFAESDIVI